MKQNALSDTFASETVTLPGGTEIVIHRPILSAEGQRQREELLRRAICQLYETCLAEQIPWDAPDQQPQN
ncbi:MAG: hypothetical protein II916_09405 [Oscillospiraceae bacterium]|nr:hypothetical protein [Oscillospiraceae bacterium]